MRCDAKRCCAVMKRQILTYGTRFFFRSPCAACRYALCCCWRNNCRNAGLLIEPCAPAARLHRHPGRHSYCRVCINFRARRMLRALSRTHRLLFRCHTKFCSRSNFCESEFSSRIFFFVNFLFLLKSGSDCATRMHGAHTHSHTRAMRRWLRNGTCEKRIAMMWLPLARRALRSYRYTCIDTDARARAHGNATNVANPICLPLNINKLNC